MPRWKDLPEDLDPQIREFTGQVRRLVDRSGLSVAALADRTGYSKTSWERYLSGRLLAPKGAVVALAEVTGTNSVHLGTMWELAERAWSRAEMRHDRTMEAIRISQARAALGEFGAAEAAGGRASGRKANGATAVTGIAGPAGVSPTIPPQPTAPDADAREAGGRDRADLPGRGPVVGLGPGRAPRGGGGREAADGPSDGPVDGAGGLPAAREGDGGSGGNSWGLAGYQGPSRASARPAPGTRAATDAAAANAAPTAVADAAGPVGAPGGSGSNPNAPEPYDGQPRASGPAGGGPAKQRAGRQRVILFVSGLVGVLVIIAAVFFFTDRSGARHRSAGTSPSPTAATRTSAPPGVKCTGSACDGKDAETMGCSGDLVTTAKTVTLGTTTLEVRYSKACGTAWGRITGAAQGDKVQVSAGTVRQSGETSGVGDTIAYTPMVAVKNPAEAKACATLASGPTACTR